MKNLYLLPLFIAFFFNVNALFSQSVINISDPIFKDYLLSIADDNNDGELSTQEANNIESISLGNDKKEVRNLTGIESLINLTSFSAAEIYIKEFDLSANVYINNIDLYIADSLVNIKLPASQTLKIVTFANVRSLESIYIPTDNSLEEFYIGQAGKLSHLDFYSLRKLKKLGLNGANNLDNIIDFSNSASLEHLDLYNITSSAIDLSGLTNLRSLKLSYTKFREIDLSSSTLLETLDIFFSYINKLDVSNNTKLTSLDCGGYNRLLSCIKVWDISYAESNIDFIKPDLASWTIDECIESEMSIYMPDYHLRESLFELGADSDSNGFISKDEANSFSSKIIIPEYLELKSLVGLEEFKSVDNISIINCYLDTIDIDFSEMTNLDTLILDKNNLKNLNIRSGSITYLSFDFNQVEEMSTGSLPNLKSIWCKGNKLRELDVSKSIYLETIWCEINKLTGLYTENNTNLETLIASKNRLLNIDLRANKKLNYLSISNNYLVCTSVYDPSMEGVDYHKDVFNNLTGNVCDKNEFISEFIDIPDTTFKKILLDDIYYVNKDENEGISVSEARYAYRIWIGGVDSTVFSLKGVEFFEYLREFHMASNQYIGTCDFSSFNYLYTLTLRDRKLDSINLTGDVNLQRLHIYNSKLKELNLTNNEKLRYFGSLYNDSLKTICLYNNDYAIYNPTDYKKDEWTEWGTCAFMSNEELTLMKARVFPVPLTDNYLIIDSKEECVLDVLDLTGSVIKSEIIIEEGQNKIELYLLPQMYILRFTGPELVYYDKIIVK